MSFPPQSPDPCVLSFPTLTDPSQNSHPYSPRHGPQSFLQPLILGSSSLPHSSPNPLALGPPLSLPLPSPNLPLASDSLSDPGPFLPASLTAVREPSQDPSQGRAPRVARVLRVLREGVVGAHLQYPRERRWDPHLSTSTPRPRRSARGGSGLGGLAQGRAGGMADEVVLPLLALSGPAAAHVRGDVPVRQDLTGDAAGDATFHSPLRSGVAPHGRTAVGPGGMVIRPGVGRRAGPAEGRLPP